MQKIRDRNLILKNIKKTYEKYNKVFDKKLI